MEIILLSINMNHGRAISCAIVPLLFLADHSVRRKICEGKDC